MHAKAMPSTRIGPTLDGNRDFFSVSELQIEITLKPLSGWDGSNPLSSWRNPHRRITTWGTKFTKVVTPGDLWIRGCFDHLCAEYSQSNDHERSQSNQQKHEGHKHRWLQD